ncbi:MAG: formylglycine-generating enzyme family protein [Hylemonella sp.]
MILFPRHRLLASLATAALLLSPARALNASAQALEMIRIPAGPFTMGSDDGLPDERPAHRVTLAAFEIDRLQTSNAEFADFLQRHGTTDAQGRRYFDWDDADARIHRVGGVWRADPGFENHPVVEVSWLGAQAYCRALGKRLPTEAEWEKAARGPHALRYPWGNSTPTPAQARFASGWNQTAPVDAYAAHASPYGVVGMAGNAWHWVASAYRPYPYREDDGREDLAPGPVRATRGGGHDSPAVELRSTERGLALSRAPAAGHHNIGFRCAR